MTDDHLGAVETATLRTSDPEYARLWESLGGRVEKVETATERLWRKRSMPHESERLVGAAKILEQEEQAKAEWNCPVCHSNEFFLFVRARNLWVECTGCGNGTYVTMPL